MSGMVNVVVLFLMAGYLNGFWCVGLLQVGLYILTPYLVSGIMALGILSMEAGRKHSFLFGISGVFLSIGYGIIGTIPRSHDSGGHVDMGSGLDCVDNFICDSGENGI